jgi:hypothetical protein
MDEAKRAGHDTVIDYLEALSTKTQVRLGTARWHGPGGWDGLLPT